MVQKLAPPVIGVTGPDKGGTMAWWWTSRALRKAGAKPIRITPATAPSLHQTLPTLQGVVLGGGADLAPATLDNIPGEMADMLYYTGEESRKETRKWKKLRLLLLFPFLVALRILLRLKPGRYGHPSQDDARDTLELELLEHCLQHNLPVLGICRGMQLINAHFKGTLHKEVRLEYGEKAITKTLFPIKDIHVAKDSLLARITSTLHLRANALHHQSIHRLGQGLRVIAQDTREIVQGIEGTNYNFVLGVQWHPEYLPHLSTHRRIFQGLVQAAQQQATS